MPRGPFIAIPLTASVVMRGHNTQDNRPIVNVFHARVGGAPTASNLTDIADVFIGELTEVVGNYPSDYQFDQVQVTDLNTSSGAQVTITNPITGTGVNGLPNMCAVVEFFTAHRGRSHTGRAFLPLCGDNVVQATGLLATGVAANYANQFGDIQSELAALSPASTLVVASRKLASSDNVVTFAARAKAGFLRRRTFG